MYFSLRTWPFSVPANWRQSKKVSFFAIFVSKFVTTVILSKPILIKIIPKPEKIMNLMFEFGILSGPKIYLTLLRLLTEHSDVIYGQTLTHADHSRNEFLLSLGNIITPKLPIGLFTSACRCQLPAGHFLNECRLVRVLNLFNPIHLQDVSET